MFQQNPITSHQPLNTDFNLFSQKVLIDAIQIYGCVIRRVVRFNIQKQNINDKSRFQ